jgi:hypothetical protein
VNGPAPDVGLSLAIPPQFVVDSEKVVLLSCDTLTDCPATPAPAAVNASVAGDTATAVGPGVGVGPGVAVPVPIGDGETLGAGELPPPPQAATANSAAAASGGTSLSAAVRQAVRRWKSAGRRLGGS